MFQIFGSKQIKGQKLVNEYIQRNKQEFLYPIKDARYESNVCMTFF